MSESIFAITTNDAFESHALRMFKRHYQTVPVYRRFCDLLKTDPALVRRIEDIPFLPVELFKTQRILEDGLEPQLIFESSGTSGTQRSQHYVADLELYQQSFELAFKRRVGDPRDMVILALLPSYLERQGSSLVYMANRLIELSGHPDSGFYLDRYDILAKTLQRCESQKMPTLLLGVTFALLELAEKHPMPLKHSIVMETGGMKGRRKEMVREEVHQVLRKAFGLGAIWSEYGMTELLSQAYSKGGGMFYCPPWMRVLTRDPEDPFSYVRGRTGGLNIIDLANRHSCAFIATQDLGKNYPDGGFEVLGRFDQSDIRGCNLMVL